jgi:hypothetical protein
MLMITLGDEGEYILREIEEDAPEPEVHAHSSLANPATPSISLTLPSSPSSTPDLIVSASAPALTIEEYVEIPDEDESGSAIWPVHAMTDTPSASSSLSIPAKHSDSGPLHPESSTSQVVGVEEAKAERTDSSAQPASSSSTSTPAFLVSKKMWDGYLDDLQLRELISPSLRDEW